MILEYYRHPRNKGRSDVADIHAKVNNPLCGDVCEMFVELGEDGTIEKVLFDGVGCAISMASASILTKLVKGRTVEEVREMDKEELLDTLGITLSPNRLKCALLGLETLKAGVRQHKGENVHLHNH